MKLAHQLILVYKPVLHCGLLWQTGAVSCFSMPHNASRVICVVCRMCACDGPQFSTLQASASATQGFPSRRTRCRPAAQMTSPTSSLQPHSTASSRPLPACLYPRHRRMLGVEASAALCLLLSEPLALWSTDAPHHTETFQTMCCSLWQRI